MIMIICLQWTSITIVCHVLLQFCFVYLVNKTIYEIPSFKNKLQGNIALPVFLPSVSTHGHMDLFTLSISDVASDVSLIKLPGFLNKPSKSLYKQVATPMDQIWCKLWFWCSKSIINASCKRSSNWPVYISQRIASTRSWNTRLSPSEKFTQLSTGLRGKGKLVNEGHFSFQFLARIFTKCYHILMFQINH